MLWPGFFALLFGALLLLQSCTAEEEFAMMSWAGLTLYSNGPCFFRTSDYSHSLHDEFERDTAWAKARAYVLLSTKGYAMISLTMKPE